MDNIDLVKPLGVPHKSYFDLRNEWTVTFYRVAEVVKQLEEELTVMKEKGVPAPILDKRDNQINVLIDFYNSTENILKIYDENLKDYRHSCRSDREDSDFAIKQLIKNLEFMVKTFKSKADGTK